MRRTAYIGASVAAATAVILRAFHERPNFYSATVYLGQSTACRMILLNMLLLTLGASMYSLQRLLYGRLRAIEIEQLWDKAWYAITETALAMTTFRDEVGGYFFLMFMTLLAGKVWGWIGEGRVETLEQQPPANPKTFYTRLTTSLVLSVGFDLLMARYCLRSILDQRPPRAGMMIMFVFEFVILAITSTSTLARFALVGYEKHIITLQTRAKVRERREEIRADRATALEQEPVALSAGAAAVNSTNVEDIEVDENEIDVPGWQEKGKWVLFLDLATDFLKLVFYLGFFMVLIIFAGIPIHMFRDLFITTRSFLKRINDYLKYRNATRDMNTRYPDATVEELHRDGTCIICREEMRPWQAPQPNPPQNMHQGQNRSMMDERQRPKKLPCGHILHFGCLRSWLERQQVCPTCRRSVLAPDPARQPVPNANGQPQNGPNGQTHVNQQVAPPDQPQQQNQQQQGRPPAPGLDRVRTLNLGGFRFTLATGRGVNVRDAMNQMQNQAENRTSRPRTDVGNPANVDSSPQSNQNITGTVSDDLQSAEQRIMQEINSLNLAQQELHLVRAMQRELSRLRTQHPGGLQTGGQQRYSGSNITAGALNPSVLAPQQVQLPSIANVATNNFGNEQQVFGSSDGVPAAGPGDTSLPPGMALPEGWTLLPLQRFGGESFSTSEEEVLMQAPHASASSQRSENRNNVVSPSSSSLETNSRTSMAIEAQQRSRLQASSEVNEQEDRTASASQSSFEGHVRNEMLNGNHEITEASGGADLSPPSDSPPLSDTMRRPSHEDAVRARDENTSSVTAPPDGRSSSSTGKGRVATVEDTQEDD